MPKSVKRITITLFLPAGQDSAPVVEQVSATIREALYHFQGVALARTQTNLTNIEDPDFLPSVAKIVYPDEKP
jgi:hypothetical protein